MFGTRGQNRDRGQILVLFALMLTALTLIAALLYSGATALVMRRQMQNAGDAAALAAANLMEQGTAKCSSTRISPTLSGNDLYVAAKTSVKANLGWTDAQVTARMTLSCPSDYDISVKVTLTGTGPRFFGAGSLAVTTSSTGINGQVTTGDYSVALLDPSLTGWRSGANNGCPSYLIDGGVTVTYEGSIYVDSTCTRSASTNAAVKAGNSAFSMTMLNGATMQIAGEAQLGTLPKITPTPTQDLLTYKPDPLSGLTKPCHATDGTNCLGTTSTLPARNTTTTGSGDCKNQKVVCVLYPGTYTGGLLAANGSQASTLLLRPGVYFLAGGGFQLKSSAAVIAAIPSATGSCTGVIGGTCTDAQAITRYCNPTNNNNGSCQLSAAQVATNWESDCPAPTVTLTLTCGVLIYNAPADGATAWSTNGANDDSIKVGSQGEILLRAYQSAYNNTSNGSGSGTNAPSTTFKSYDHLVIWQARTPLPTPSTPQPTIAMHGGGCAVLSGTVYGSGAPVDFGGNSCGSGGGDATLTLQFICWDLDLSGTSNYYFAYNRNAFTLPFAYGLIR